MKLTEARIGVLEDDGVVNDLLRERLEIRVGELVIFEDIDTAERVLIAEKAIDRLDALIVDIMLKVPEAVKLSADVRDYNAGIVYHEDLERRVKRAVPVVFYTGVSGARIRTEEMDDRVKRYVAAVPQTRCYIPKHNSKIDDIVNALESVLSASRG